MGVSARRPRYNYDVFPFYDFAELSGGNSPSRHFRRFAFLSKSAILSVCVFVCVGGISVRFAPTTITRGPHFPILPLYRTFGKVIPRIAAPDGPHFGPTASLLVR